MADLRRKAFLLIFYTLDTLLDSLDPFLNQNNENKIEKIVKKYLYLYLLEFKQVRILSMLVQFYQLARILKTWKRILLKRKNLYLLEFLLGKNHTC
jgi:hypothetical protein